MARARELGNQPRVAPPTAPTPGARTRERRPSAANTVRAAFGPQGPQKLYATVARKVSRPNLSSKPRAYCTNRSTASR